MFAPSKATTFSLVTSLWSLARFTVPTVCHEPFFFPHWLAKSCLTGWERILWDVRKAPWRWHVTVDSRLIQELGGSQPHCVVRANSGSPSLTQRLRNWPRREGQFSLYLSMAVVGWNLAAYAICKDFIFQLVRCRFHSFFLCFFRRREGVGRT